MDVYCVIVCYWPNLNRLKLLCQTLWSDGCRIILLDNSETPSISEAELEVPVHLCSFLQNTGLAHAQNVGIEKALKKGAKVIVFFDQDSTISSGFVKEIITPIRLGCPDIVAPLSIDDLTGVALRTLRMSQLGLLTEVYCDESMLPCEVDIVISSGTAVTAEVFAVAGLFDEALFIDHVDTEWCLRCRKLGIPIRIVPSAVMHHRIGNNVISEGPFTILVHSPLRCYFQIRNSIYLFRKHHIPLFFSVREFVSIVISRALLLRHVDNKISYIRAYALGIRDGLLGVTGPPSSGF